MYNFYAKENALCALMRTAKMYVTRVKNETWNCSAAAAADHGPSRNIYVYIPI